MHSADMVVQSLTQLKLVQDFGFVDFTSAHETWMLTTCSQQWMLTIKLLLVFELQGLCHCLIS
jgi:hypothetical protein